MTENVHKLDALMQEADAIARELRAMFPDLAEARRRFVTSHSADDRRLLERIEERAGELHAEYRRLVKEIQVVAGIPDEVLEEIERERHGGDSPPRMQRGQLTSSAIATTGKIEDILAGSWANLERSVDANWLKEIQTLPRQLAPDIFEKPLSLVRGLRPESEFPSIHRFAQAMLVTQDFMRDQVGYDHFAGAMLVPQVARLAQRLELLRGVRGALDTRLNGLWERPSAEADSTIFELLVAAGCAELGREVEFLKPQTSPTPDLRCHDPFPLVIECKRKRSLSNYELREEREMRLLFEKLYAQVRKSGVWGSFYVELAVEADKAPHDEVAGCLVRQRLAPHPQRFLQYPWGKVAYRELPRRLSCPRTRLYSPNMLGFAFGWNSDLPEWDGLIARVQSHRELVVSTVEDPVAVLWTNTSESAVRKRSWGPTDILGDAVRQIPPGEFGIAYVAYQEGTREEIADRRTTNFVERVRDWTHSARIRMPLCFLNRLYARPLNDGQPDLIESTVNFIAEYSDAALARAFPGAVFTRP